MQRQPIQRQKRMACFQFFRTVFSKQITCLLLSFEKHFQFKQWLTKLPHNVTMLYPNFAEADPQAECQEFEYYWCQETRILKKSAKSAEIPQRLLRKIEKLLSRGSLKYSIRHKPNVSCAYVLPQARQVIVHAEFALHDLDLGLAEHPAGAALL